MSYTPLTSDESVSAKTGKVWDRWFTFFDAVGAKKLDHPDIAELAQAELARTKKPTTGSRGWWSQMIAVEYE